LSDAERRARGIRRLPDTLDAALDALEADPLLMEAMGPLLARSYLAVRRSEADFYRDQDTEFEIAGHFYRY
jgi:glutamine synthetase